MENWRRFVNEDYRKGNIGTDSSPEKEKLRQRFSSAFSDAIDSDVNQFLSVVLGEKPMFYDVVKGDGVNDGINLKDEKLKRMIDGNPNLKYAYAPHTEIGRADNTVLFFGKPENVNAAVKLSKSPLIGKEQYGLEDEFWEFVHPRYFKVTPEWNKQLGILLGYGEENAETFAKNKEKNLMYYYSEWKKMEAEHSDFEGVETVALQERERYVKER